ncbi:MAG TPA: hypothetical protein VK557_05010 [Pyrinomonadaceae bacterium]|nr:hypothetical protein [Pyrinomonadaceae bacterium]
MKFVSVTTLLLALLPVPRLAHAQRKKPVLVCTQAGFAAFKPLPKLEYECPEGQADYGDEILKLPSRLAAIHKLERSLESFTSAAWWNANVDELNGCEIHGRAGKLTAEEKQKVDDNDYDLKIFGNHQMRLAVLADPCYETGYSGSNAFLLVRRAGRVFVSQVLNGYASRFGNSVGVDFADLKGQTIVEISTATSLPPSLWYHYFVIDPGTNKVVPKTLFKEDNKLTNGVYSDMLMGDPKDFDLPKDATELNIIRNGRLAPSFSAYTQDENGKVDGRLRRIIYRWNGRFYVPSR